MDQTFWALVGLIIFIGIVIWAKVPGKITSALDDRADGIRKELEEARRLREEAQALLADYQRKHREAEEEAETIVAEARREAELLTVQTEAALNEMIERRTRLAETKIAMAESQAMAEVKARATDVAVAAAEKILEAKVTGKVAEKLLADSIKEVGSRIN
ncbi:F-type H+-transporting ATPase subunit b [Breoghania corrubedonensis]|uniref:ATP synthase subunit b n=1 Tax=Breoghania corrubedonensis TaxID=665038 RepID=A0A2T5VEQ3_9HYPH|nr:F0F1 ATP synthase subunit B [Breoghania corrubedonensis]PTW62227.1 F-type H+-transporting ATPase subunit b [Breoghania corrubedonensis]